MELTKSIRWQDTNILLILRRDALSTQALLLVSALLLGAWSPSLLIPEIVLELLEQVLMGTHPLTPSTNIIGARGSPPSNSSRSSTIGNPSSPPPNQFLVPASSPVCSPSPEWHGSSTLTCFTSYSRISSYNNHPPKLLIFMRVGNSLHTWTPYCQVSR